jgi:hypothetical protein
MRAASSICRKRSHIRRWAFSISSKSRTSLLAFREHFAEAPGAAGFVAHEELHAIQVKEFGHIKSEDVIISKQVAGEFQRQFGFTDTCRTKEKE